MELILSAIASGGLIGASDQYLCLLLIAIGAKTNLIEMAPQMQFMESWWFIAIMALFWLITLAPAYASLLSPGVMNVVNTVTKFLSGFVVPVSGALVALAAAGFIVEMHPELGGILETLRIFHPEGHGVGGAGWIIAGGGAAAASVLGGAKFLAKPALNTATGTAGHLSAPIHATIENVASVVLMGLLYVLSQVNPWLLVVLLVVVALILLGLMGYAIYLMWKLSKGVGRVFRLIETRPKAGLAIVAEFLAWGSGWLIWKHWNRGAPRLAVWLVWLASVIFFIPAISGLLVGLPFLASAVLLVGESMTIVIGLSIGARSARSLMQTFDDAGQPIAAAVPQAAPSPTG
ncbi:MAG: DUF4126 family protein [Anaerolineae bacterium]|nr:DUF4126 family protein [Anaerolineae bacterium]